MKKRIVAHALFKTAVIGLLSLVLMEAALRLFFPRLVFHEISITRHDGQYRLSPDPGLVYVPKPNTGRFNRYGHLGPAFPFKHGEKPRIVVMGDSVVQGIDVPFGERFTERLAADLPGYEVINLGVSGYSLRQEVEYLRTLGLGFDPDYVLWGICGNDLWNLSSEYGGLREIMEASRKSAFYRDYYRAAGSLDRLLRRSMTYCYLKYAASGRAKNNTAGRDGIRDADVTYCLDRIRDMERARGFRSIFVILPSVSRVFDEDMRRLQSELARRHIEHVDYLHGFGRRYFKDQDQFHLNVAGHARLAEKLGPPLRRFLEGAP